MGTKDFFKESEKVRVVRSRMLRLLRKQELTCGQLVQDFRDNKVLGYSFWTAANLEYVKRSLKKMGLIGYDRKTQLWYYTKTLVKKEPD